MANNNTPSSGKISYTAFGLVIGMVLGGIVGLVIENMIVFAGGDWSLALPLVTPWIIPTKKMLLE